MVRTGRFGRLPTEAPDLSSQIVSMIEQQQAAVDANMLSAWSNGGKVDGKPVNDKRLLKHYKKRRDSYDRDDPEYDEWQLELTQLRFRVSNEKVMTAYARGRVGPGAVAQHYRKWAQTMPKGTSYWRSMQQSAASFNQAVSAGRAEVSKAYDYERLQRRVAGHEGPINAANKFREVLTNYARSRGLLEQAEGLFEMNTFEAADFAGLMAGAERSGDPMWAGFVESYGDEWPDWDGTLSWTDFRKMTDQAISAKRAQIGEYKKAPADYSSIIQGLRSDISDLRDVKRIEPWVHALEQYAEAHQEWLDVREAGDDPDSFLSGDETYLKDLERIRKALQDSGGARGFAAAGDVWMEMQAIKGNTDAVNGTNNDALWQNSNKQSSGSGTGQTDLEITATGQASMYAGQDLLRQGKAYKVRIAPDVSDVAQSLGYETPRTWSIRAFEYDAEGKVILPDEGYMNIMRRDSSGAVYSELLVGEPIYGPTSSTVPIGYKASDGAGVDLYKLRNPADGVSWFVTPENLFKEENGVRLSMVDGRLVVATADPDNFTAGWLKTRTESYATTPMEILSKYFGDSGVPVFGTDGKPALSHEDQIREKMDAISEAWEDYGSPYGAQPNEEMPGHRDGTPVPDSPWGPDSGRAVSLDSFADDASRPGDLSDTNHLFMAEMEKIFSDVSGPYIYDDASRKAAVRNYIRQMWNEAEDGLLPAAWQYNEEDAEYLLPDGTPTGKETPEQRVERISANDGVDIYDGGEPDFARGDISAVSGGGYTGPGIGAGAEGATELLSSPWGAGAADQRIGQRSDYLLALADGETVEGFHVFRDVLVEIAYASTQPGFKLTPELAREVMQVGGNIGRSELEMQRLSEELEVIIQTHEMVDFNEGLTDKLEAGHSVEEVAGRQQGRILEFQRKEDQIGLYAEYSASLPEPTAPALNEAQQFNSAMSPTRNQSYSEQATAGGQLPPPPPAAEVDPQVPSPPPASAPKPTPPIKVPQAPGIASPQSISVPAPPTQAPAAPEPPPPPPPPQNAPLIPGAGLPRDTRGVVRGPWGGGAPSI